MKVNANHRLQTYISVEVSSLGFTEGRKAEEPGKKPWMKGETRYTTLITFNTDALYPLNHSNENSS